MRYEVLPVGEEGGETAMLPLFWGMVMERGCMPKLGEYRSSAIQTSAKSSSLPPDRIPMVQKKYLTNFKSIKKEP